jgi:hypothetical protein
MAIGPIDYGSMLTQLDVTPLLQASQIRGQRKQGEAQTAAIQARTQLAKTELEAKAAKEAAWTASIGDVMKNPTTQGFNNLLLRYPDEAAAIKAASDAQTAGQRTRNVQAAMTLGGLVNSGMTDRALAFLQERKGALVEGGESTEVTDDLIDALKKGDTTRVKALSGLVIAGTLGDGAGDVLETLGWGPKAQRDAAKDERDAERLRLAQEREDRMERATNAAIAGRNRDDARQDRRATGGGGSGGGPSGFITVNGRLYRKKQP